MSVTFDVTTGTTVIRVPQSIADNAQIMARFQSGQAGSPVGYDPSQFGSGVWQFLTGEHSRFRDVFTLNPSMDQLQQVLGEINAILQLIAMGTLMVDNSYTPDLTALRNDLKIEIGA